MQGVKKKKVFYCIDGCGVANCVRYIIFLYRLYYFNVLNVKIKHLIFDVL